VSVFGLPIKLKQHPFCCEIGHLPFFKTHAGELSSIVTDEVPFRIVLNTKKVGVSQPAEV
jgi:hypothetical protein